MGQTWVGSPFCHQPLCGLGQGTWCERLHLCRGQGTRGCVQSSDPAAAGHHCCLPSPTPQEQGREARAVAEGASSLPAPWCSPEPAVPWRATRPWLFLLGRRGEGSGGWLWAGTASGTVGLSVPAFSPWVTRLLGMQVSHWSVPRPWRPPGFPTRWTLHPEACQRQARRASCLPLWPSLETEHGGVLGALLPRAWVLLPSLVVRPVQVGTSFTNCEMPHFLRASDCPPSPRIAKTRTLGAVSCSLQRL